MSPKGLRLTDYLTRIVEAIERIERYTAETTFEAFVTNDMTQDAVIRNLEIIGEAPRNIERSDPDFNARDPSFPLKPAVEMRNVLAHGYFGVDLDIVRTTIHTSLPALRRQARQILSATLHDTAKMLLFFFVDLSVDKSTRVRPRRAGGTPPA